MDLHCNDTVRNYCFHRFRQKSLKFMQGQYVYKTLRTFLCIRTPNTGQLNSLFHTFAEFRPISGLLCYNPIYYWMAASAQFSPNEMSDCGRHYLHLQMHLFLIHPSSGYIWRMNPTNELTNSNTFLTFCFLSCIKLYFGCDQ